MLAAETVYIYIYNASNDNIQVKGVKGHSAHWENDATSKELSVNKLK